MLARMKEKGKNETKRHQHVICSEKHTGIFKHLLFSHINSIVRERELSPLMSIHKSR